MVLETISSPQDLKQLSREICTVLLMKHDKRFLKKQVSMAGTTDQTLVWLR